VLLAHTLTRKTHSPFTTPSASQLGSSGVPPSVQRTFFCFVGVSFTGASNTRSEYVLELPPPPTIPARQAAGAAEDNPTELASDQDPPRMGWLFTTGPAARVNENHATARALRARA